MNEVGRGIVSIVTVADFGENIVHLASANTPIWIAERDVNCAAVERARRSGCRNITTFKLLPNEPEEQMLTRVINSVDLHDGPESKTDPYYGIELIVENYDHRYISILEYIGFIDIVQVGNGYLAMKQDRFKPL